MSNLVDLQKARVSLPKEPLVRKPCELCSDKRRDKCWKGKAFCCRSYMKWLKT